MGDEKKKRTIDFNPNRHGKSEMYEQMIELLETNKLSIPDVIMNPRWQDTMKNRRYFGVDWGVEDSEHEQPVGFTIRYSPFVESGEVYLIDKPVVPFKLRQEFEHRIWADIDKLLFGGHYAYAPPPVIETWQQKENENLLAWGERLASKGWLDNPEIRWVYQWAILRFIIGYPFEKLKTLRK